MHGQRSIAANTEVREARLDCRWRGCYGLQLARKLNWNEVVLGDAIPHLLGGAIAGIGIGHFFAYAVLQYRHR